MIIQVTIDLAVPHLIVDGVPVAVDNIKKSAHGWSEVFVAGFARCHLLPDTFLPGRDVPSGTIRTGGHTFEWEHRQ